MKIYNRNNYDTNGKSIKCDNAYDAFAICGVNNISSYALQRTIYGCFYSGAPDTLGFLQYHANNFHLFYSSSTVLIKYYIPNNDIRRAVQLAYCTTGAELSRQIGSDGVTVLCSPSNGSAFIYSTTLPSAWTVPNATNRAISKSLTIAREPIDFATVDNAKFSTDGTKLYVMLSLYDGWAYLRQYSLSTAFDIETATYVQGFDLNALTGYGSADFYFSNDGSSIYLNSSGNFALTQHSLSTAWDISTIGSALYSRPMGGWDIGWYPISAIDNLNRQFIYAAKGTSNANIHYCLQ